MKKALPVLSLLLLAASPVAAAKPDPAAMASAFYAVYMELHPQGVPDSAQRARFKPTISAALAKQLDDAAAAEEDYNRKTKNQSPPLAEGDLLTSLFEGATSYEVSSCALVEDGKAKCIMSFNYNDHKPKHPVLNWKDVLLLTEATGGWAVDDIAYGGNWQFGNHGRLRDNLSDIVKASKED